MKKILSLLLGILLVSIYFISSICYSSCNYKPNNEYIEVYYNVPTYTTIYEIVYPDSVYRYKVIHHSPSRLSSHRGSNFLYSSQHHIDNWGDRNRPKYWKDEWNDKELNIETTSPIRIVSETVQYHKTKYKIRNN